MVTTQQMRLWGVLMLLGAVGILSLLLTDLPLPAAVREEVSQIFSQMAIRGLSLINPVIYLFFAVTLGILLYQRLDFKLPVLENLVYQNKRITTWNKWLKYGILGGLFSGVGIAVIAWYFAAAVPQELHNLTVHPVTRFLYGGITEELLMRFGVLTFIAWLLQLLTRSKANGVYWAAIFLSAFLFALGHLPILTVLDQAPTPALIAYILLGNTFGGLVFGYLYWKHNLETAMIAHIVVHVVLLVAELIGLN